MEIWRTVLITLMVILSTGIFLPYLNKPYWYIRVFDFPLQTTTTLLTLCCIVFLFTQNTFQGWFLVLLIVSILAVVLGAAKLYHYYPFFRHRSLVPEFDDPLRQVSIFSANVRQKNRRIEKLKEVAAQANADIILLYETDQWWIDKTAYLKEQYPYQILIPQGNTYGMLLYSRLKLVDHTVNFFCIEHVPSIHAIIELRNHQCFELYALHPKPPRLYQSTSARDSEVVLVGRRIRHSKTPTILAGDLNDVPWSKALTLFRKLSNTIDPRVGRGFYNTFNVFIPVFRFPLDYFQFNSEFRVVEFRREKKIGSDHFPLYIRLSFEPENPNPDNILTLDEEARSDAEEFINQEKRSIFPKFSWDSNQALFLPSQIKV